MVSYKITISKVVAGRVKPDDIIEDFGSPKYGFYWFFWLPVFKSNGGSFKRREVVDISIMFLCFSIGLIFWPKH